MNKLIKIALAAALPVLWAAGCSDFLKGGELTNNPNNPIKGNATDQNLFTAIQVNNWAMNNSEVAWSVAQWMQSLLGVARQQVGIYFYSDISNSTFDGDFIVPYTGGGLIDIRTLQAQTTAEGDSLYLGVARVMEGWIMSQTADQWGDIPYSQAGNFVTNPTPVLDTQQSVYDSTYNLLGTAIAEMTFGGNGPGSADLTYGGDATKWIALAHTLRARILLHQIAKGATTYAQVLAEANLGITDASGAGDYVAAFNSSLQFSSNNWWQFMNSGGGTGRAGDMVASVGTGGARKASYLWTLLKTSADPRFNEYFDSTNSATGEMSDYRQSAGYQQPMVTYAENELIIAEANAGMGNAAAALTALNAERASWTSANSWHQAVALTPVGSATMTQVMTEKYITMFQAVEVWNDWKRTCVPNLAAVGSNPIWPGIPSRILYGLTEQQTNPNIPAPGTAPNGAFNWNDPLGGCGTVSPP